MSKNRKHGVLSVGEVSIQSQFNSKEISKKQWLPISYCLETVFRQMKVAGNRPRNSF